MTLRILHCRTDTGRNAWTLSRAERALGLQSDVLVYASNWFGYPSDIDLHFERVPKPLRLPLVLNQVLKAACEYDVVHFNGGRSFMPSGAHGLEWLSALDVQFLKRQGVGVVVTFQGCDLRQASGASVDDICACRDGVGCNPVCGVSQDRHKARLAAHLTAHADRVFALNPDLLRYLPDDSEFLPYTTIDPREWEPVDYRVPDSGSPFRILHAPTKRGVKGTHYVTEAIDRLRSRYPNVELILVEGVPHDRVRELYSRAHLVVDQLLLGWYGGFAVETMSLGLPVIAYLRHSDLRRIPDAMRSALPLIEACPDTIELVLEAAIRGEYDLPAIARASRDYVQRWHDPISVAQRMQRVYETI